MSGNQLSPAAQLEGQILKDEWVVGPRFEKTPAATGGFFSVGYPVTGRDGRVAFLKAIDLGAVAAGMDTPDPAAAMEHMLAAFNHECKILKVCETHKMDRVVRALDSGSTRVADNPFVIVPYLIFEKADGDIRQYLANVGSFDVAWAMRCLHHLATGLKQLHTARITHQDQKPSNVLNIEGVSKLGDLGRAIAVDTEGLHTEQPIPGDRGYAPPEQLYGYCPTDFGERRLAADLYQFGNIAVFLFSNANVTGSILSHLHPDHYPPSMTLSGGWQGSFEDVLPFVRQAYERSLEEFEACLSRPALAEQLRSDMVRLVRSLTDPDPRRRGHPKTVLSRVGSQYSMERYVAQLNFMAQRAEMSLRRTAK